MTVGPGLARKRFTGSTTTRYMLLGNEIPAESLTVTTPPMPGMLLTTVVHGPVGKASLRSRRDCLPEMLAKLTCMAVGVSAMLVIRGALFGSAGLVPAATSCAFEKP